MWKKLIGLCVILITTNTALAHQPSDKLLTAFHLAASKADYEGYFSLLADNAVFLGTDPSERWTKSEFSSYVKPYFAQGKGWTYKVKSRHFTVVDEDRLVIFDEMLTNEFYGNCRGTGAIRNDGVGWKIVQYNLSVPFPNDIANDVIKQIKAFEQKQQAQLKSK